VQIRTSNAAPPTEDLVLDVRPTVGGLPVEDDTLALATVQIQAEDIPSFVPLTGDFVAVDLRPFSIFVTPGDAQRAQVYARVAALMPSKAKTRTTSPIRIKAGLRAATGAARGALCRPREPQVPDCLKV
jgi:hypothetical protein